MIPPSQFKNQLAQAVTAAAAPLHANIAVDYAGVLERPRMHAHGDLSCPLALMLAKRLKQNPQSIAEQITAALELPPFVAEVQIAAPGFINFTIADAAKVQVISEILAAGYEYGRCPPQRKSLLIEFVSANPTGPLHVGHGRACAYGDALANILQAVGIDVRREYYVNDAGRQMEVLATSVWLRHGFERDVKLLESGYRGDYLIGIAQQLSDQLDQICPAEEQLDRIAELVTANDTDPDPDNLLCFVLSNLKKSEAFPDLCRQVSEIMLEQIIKPDMRALNVQMEGITFFSETTLHDEGEVSAVIEALRKNDQLYEKDGALWFKSSAWGDEKDRVVQRANGQLTYFAADIAYHINKLTRAHPAENDYKIINVLGADHHGYVPRLSAAVQALGWPPDCMETEIIQFVSLFEDGKRLKMSTRAGEFVTMRELVDAVGCEAARYYYLNRKNDQHLDFDIAAARAQARQNPIWYLHYASARVNSLISKKWGGDPEALKQAEVDCLTTDAAALQLCDMLMRYPETVQRAAAERAPHLLTVYSYELATGLHNYYEGERILPPPGDPPADTMEARLALLSAVQTVLHNAAGLLGLKLKKEVDNGKKTE